MSEREAELAFLEGAVRALRRRAEAIRKKAALGVTSLDGYQPVVLVVDSKAAHLFRIARDWSAIADDLGGGL